MLNITSVASIRETQKIVMEHSRLKIPLIFAYDVIHGYKTTFPLPLGLASTWDMELIEKTAQIAAKEATADGTGHGGPQLTVPGLNDGLGGFPQQVDFHKGMVEGQSQTAHQSQNAIALFHSDVTAFGSDRCR